MDLHSAHTFTARPDRVANAMLDPEFYTALRLPDLEPPEVLERNEHDDTVTLRVQYRFSGSLDPLARTVLGTDRVSWIQQLSFQPAAGTGTLTITPGVQADRVTCSGMVSIEPTPDGARRTLVGTLRIAIPIVGGRAERALAPGIQRRLDLEAEALAAFITDQFGP